MEILIRWRCPCHRSAHYCPYCEGKEYVELWVADDLVQHVVGGTDFLIQGRRETQKQLTSSAPADPAAPVQKRATVSSSTLFVQGLPPSFTIRDLEEMFAPFGLVLWSRIIDRSSEYSGWGYVDMPTPAQAEAALQVLDGSKIEEHRIVVMLSIHAPYALQADRFLQLNLGKAFCELCIRAHATPSNVFPKQLLDAFYYLYECQYFVGVCNECHKTAQVFAASLDS
jgi:hypothetical protein